MLKLKAKQPQKEVSERKPEVALADHIKQIRQEAEEFVESKVRELKASPEGQSLPIDWLRLNVYATTHSGSCHCKCALAMLEKENNG